MNEASTAQDYQLHILLRKISTSIWCRVWVCTDSTIADPHYTLQLAMEWTDSHLNRFLIFGTEYGVPHIGGSCFSDDSRQIQLADFRFLVRERFLYEHDFGDLWQHNIRVERIELIEPKNTYPVCIRERWACPPEASGGPWGFTELEQFPISTLRCPDNSRGVCCRGSNPGLTARNGFRGSLPRSRHVSNCPWSA